MWASRRHLFLALAVAVAACGDDRSVRETVDPVYRPGQEWSFIGRPGEEAATFTVLRVDDVSGSVVVHVAVHGIRLDCPSCADGTSTEIEHLPVLRTALDASAPRLAREDVPVPPFASGYDDWVAHRGGSWSVPLPQVLDAVEATLAADP